ncbi:hypothetical protein G7Z17_g5743 [Cylindrodendrum hubeiense]|uniref:Uncharacterized protein n=1 Tax=Cylindrodendrum hubeiense TaxID=595255 RepID=A0A9P5HBH0_9HYPO|nr:hypothetical protein G7Z17_g5743 [Cylindrodendrum hubeiense]
MSSIAAAGPVTPSANWPTVCMSAYTIRTMHSSGGSVMAKSRPDEPYYSRRRLGHWRQDHAPGQSPTPQTNMLFILDTFT